MVDSLLFTADDDDDFGYEEEQIDVTTEVGEYGPEDEDDDELTRPVPEPVHMHSPSRPCSPVPVRRGSAAKETGKESGSEAGSRPREGGFSQSPRRRLQSPRRRLQQRRLPPPRRKQLPRKKRRLKKSRGQESGGKEDGGQGRQESFH